MRPGESGKIAEAEAWPESTTGCVLGASGDDGEAADGEHLFGHDGSFFFWFIPAR